jgi:hypothetical protein
VLTPVPHVTEHDEDETGIADHWYEMGAKLGQAAAMQGITTVPLLLIPRGLNFEPIGGHSPGATVAPETARQPYVSVLMPAPPHVTEHVDAAVGWGAQVYMRTSTPGSTSTAVSYFASPTSVNVKFSP